MRKRELLRSLFPMDQRGVLLMDKTWRSRVFGQGAHEVRWTSALRRPERSEEFDSLLWWIHGVLDVEAEGRHEEVQKG